MVDQAKRDTLKNVASLGAGSIAIAASPSVLAQFTNSTESAASGDVVDIQVSTRLSSTTNDLEVVLTNTGSVPATLSGMAPDQIDTARGRFNFSALFDSGDVRMGLGESISVPMQHHTVVLDATAIGKRTEQLSKALRQGVSIKTKHGTLAVVHIDSTASFA